MEDNKVYCKNCKHLHYSVKVKTKKPYKFKCLCPCKERKIIKENFFEVEYSHEDINPEYKNKFNDCEYYLDKINHIKNKEV